MTCLLACSPSIRLAIGAFLPCAGGCGVLVRSCLRSAPAGVGFWSVPVWGWPVGWFGLVVFSPFLLGLCGLLGGLRPFVSLVWSCWHLLRRLPFTSARSTWGPFTSQSPHIVIESLLFSGRLSMFTSRYCVCGTCPYILKVKENEREREKKKERVSE